MGDIPYWGITEDIPHRGKWEIFLIRVLDYGDILFRGNMGDIPQKGIVLDYGRYSS